MAASAPPRYPDPVDIQNLKSYELAPRLLVEGYLQGRHKSPDRGHSTEFRDFREYSPGDDLRLMDWRVYARTDKHFVRVYEEETDMTVYLFLDSSASMGYGRPPKLHYASLFAAALAYLAVRQGDRASLLTFDDELREFFPPGGTQPHLRSLCRTLEENAAGSETSVAEALRKGFPLCRKRGTLIVISDFFDDVASIFSALDQYIHRHFEVVLFHVIDPTELELERRGAVEFCDLETAERVVLNTDRLAAEYRRRLERFIGSMRALAVRRQVDYVLARTDTHYFTLFDKYLKRKVR
jgi:uncharacterized protein (DUF58 family)